MPQILRWQLLMRRSPARRLKKNHGRSEITEILALTRARSVTPEPLAAAIKSQSGYA